MNKYSLFRSIPSTASESPCLVVSAPACGVRLSEDPSSNLTANSCVYRDGYCDIQPWERARLYCSAYRPCIPSGSLNRVQSASAGVRVGAGRKVASAGWQVTLCDPTWHVTSRSGDAGLLTKGEPLYRVYLLFFTFSQLVNTTRQNVGSAVSDGSCVSAIRNAGIRLTVCQSTSIAVMSHTCDSARLRAELEKFALSVKQLRRMHLRAA